MMRRDDHLGAAVERLRSALEVASRGGQQAEARDRQADRSVRGRERVLAMYTWDKTAAGYLSVISDGVGSGSFATGPVPGLDASERIKAYLESGRL